MINKTIILIFLLSCILLGCQKKQSKLDIHTYIPADQIELHEFNSVQAAATNGDSVAQYNLGNIYYEGLGVRRSHKKAMEWWNKSSLQGYAPAQYNLGELYFTGEGIKRDFVEGCKWLKTAASQGHIDAVKLYKHKCAD